jgi:hypothetical protein
MEPHVAKIMTYQETTQAMWEKTEKIYDKKKKLLIYLSAPTRDPAN